MGQTYPTSKINALASLASWMQTNVLDTNESLFMGNYDEAIQFPCFSFIDKGAPDLPPTAFYDMVGNAPGDNFLTGRISQTVVEVNALDKYTTVNSGGGQNPDAVNTVFLMRERFRRALYYAGQLDTNGNYVVPNIQLLDFDTNGNPATGGCVYWPSEEANTWFETSYLASSDDPQLKRIQMLVRIRWTEIQ